MVCYGTFREQGASNRFFTQTLGSKVELYERLLSEKGVNGTYVPAEQ